MPWGYCLELSSGAMSDDPQEPSLDGMSCDATRPPSAAQKTSHRTHVHAPELHCRPKSSLSPLAHTHGTACEQSAVTSHEPPSPTARVFSPDEVDGITSAHEAPLVPALHAVMPTPPITTAAAAATPRSARECRFAHGTTVPCVGGLATRLCPVRIPPLSKLLPRMSAAPRRGVLGFSRRRLERLAPVTRRRPRQHRRRTRAEEEARDSARRRGASGSSTTGRPRASALPPSCSDARSARATR